ECALARFLDRLAVHDRIRERDADLDRVGAACHAGPHDFDPVLAETAGDVGHQQLATAVAALAEMLLHIHDSTAPPSRSMSCCASLPPRPESVSSTVAPLGMERPHSRMSHPMACAGSSAGTMPSVCASNWKPATASSSVA